MKSTFRDPVGVIGTGSYVPERVVTNSEIAARVAGTNDDWIREKLGIRERRVAAEGESTSTLAAKAGERALADAGVQAGDLDLIIVATATPDRLSPSTACIVQETLGAFRAAAFDVAAVCSGFLYGFSMAANFIASGACRNILLIGADTFSRITDWDDRSCVFFGDGAGAAVISSVPAERGVIAIDLYADGRGKWNFTVPAGGSEMPACGQTLDDGLHTFRMNGQEVFRTATTVLPDAIASLLQRCGVSVDDVDVLVPHQPSVHILRVTAEKLGMPFSKVMTNMDRFANTAGASVAILLDEANRTGRLRDGALVALAAVGSGWTWGAGLMRWYGKE